MLNFDDLADFIEATGLSEILRQCTFDHLDHEFYIYTIPRLAEKLWLNHTLIAHALNLHLPKYKIVNIDGSPVNYDFEVEDVLATEALGFEVIANSSMSHCEKDIIISAIASNNSFAIVRDRDNRVILAGQNITRFCTPPASLWANYDITELWRQDDEPIGKLPRELQRMYRYRERGELYIPQFEYVSFRADLNVENQTIERGKMANFLSNVWFLNGDYFGEPCRLVMAIEANDITDSA